MRVVAAVDSFDACTVGRTALAVARATNADISVVHAREDGRDPGRRTPTLAAASAAAVGVPLRVVQGPPVEVILQEVAPDDVVAVVVGTHTWPVGSRVGDVTRGVIETVGKPLFVVPPAAAPSVTFERVLLPLGIRGGLRQEVVDSTRALIGPRASFFPLHVLPDSAEFDARNRFTPVAEPIQTAEGFRPAASRSNEPVQDGVEVSGTIVDTVAAQGTDLIVLAEPQSLPAVTLRVLETSIVPVLLLSTTTSASISRDQSKGATPVVDRWGHPSDILLIEDDPGHARLTRRALDAVPLLNALRVVPSGEAALAFLHRQPPYEDAVLPGLILLDLNLPGMDGRDILRHIKTDPVLRRIPVAVLTSSQYEMDVDLVYELGATCLIHKPVRFAEFVVAIQTLGRFWFAAVTPPRIDVTG